MCSWLNPLIMFLILLGPVETILASPGKSCTQHLREVSGRSLARQEFSRLSQPRLEHLEGGWVGFEFNPRGVELDPVLRLGRPVALLVRDPESKGGEKLVRGFIYNVLLKDSLRMKVDDYLKTLSPAEARAFKRGRLFGANAEVIVDTYAVQITTQPPQYVVDYSRGYQRVTAASWRRKPSASRMMELENHDILAAKYFISP